MWVPGRRSRGCARRTTFALAGAAFVLVSALPAAAAPGDLLAPFGSTGCDDGIEDIAYGAADRSDGSVIAVGTARIGRQDQRAYTCMFEPDGDFDQRWGGTGWAVIAFPNAARSALRGVAVDARDRPVVVGYTYDADGNPRAVVARLRGGGAFDSSFAGNGIVYFGNLPGRSLGEAVAIDRQGRIVVAGTAGYPDDPHPFVVRLLPDGRRDTTFGRRGTRRFRPVVGGMGELGDITLVPRGRIALLTTSTTTPTRDFVTIMIHADGKLDTDFGRQGRRRIDFAAGGADTGAGIAVTRDGGLLLTGESSGSIALARLDPSGKLDTSFGINGVNVISIASANARGNDVIQIGGRILVAADVILSGGADRGWTLGFTSAGATDTSWGTNGTVTTGNTRGSHQALERKRGGGVFIIGALKTPIGTFSDNDFAVAARSMT